MRLRTKEQIKTILATPNGSEKLMEDADSAFAPAWELFKDEHSAPACAFLCRAAKKLSFRRLIEENLVESRQVLYDALSSDEPKLRKNASRLTGALMNALDAPYLIEALKKEDARFVRPSMVLALGAIGSVEAQQYLLTHTVMQPESDADKRHFTDETDALKKALSSFVKLEKHAFTGLKECLELELHSPDMLSGGLKDELTALGLEAECTSESTVKITTSDIQKVYQARSFTELLFPIRRTMSRAPKAIAITAKPFLEKLMINSHTGEPPFGYRIEIRGETERAAMAKGIADVLDQTVLKNSPSDYEAELRICCRKNGSCDVFVKLFTVPDVRFAYRTGAIAASINPATAAAVLRFAKAYLKPGARVLDPCCGSGTMLFEREMLTDVSSVTGVEISHKTVELARANAQAGQSKAKFVTNDCLRFEAERRYDEVISNLPFGNRVGSHENNVLLYAGLLDRLPKWLSPDGVAVLYTMEFTLLKNLVRERKNLTLVTEVRTESGGLMPGIFIIKMK